MVAPTIISRADHPISRTEIDPDALKVLYRLRKFNHTAYLVGGGVRDLLLERHPKDFDIGTSAHPNEVKRIFRNCWIIGRRFRLAHIKFEQKTIEVATFRRQVPQDAEPAPADTSRGQARPRVGLSQRLIRRDNTFGTPEEDAFRRDFTINALFYDIATFAIIDYVGGMEDLQNGLIRCIGNPNERFIEDSVRMLRAIALGARLGFRIDTPVHDAIARHHAEIVNASPARMIEEVYKILRSGVSADTFRALSKARLLKHIAPEIDRQKSAALWHSLEQLDLYRQHFKSAPECLTNAVLLGSLVAPSQKIALQPRRRADGRSKGASGITVGQLPVARRDVERFRQLLALQPRLLNPDLPPRIQRTLLQRGSFADALTWLEIHGTDPDALERWRGLVARDGPVAQERQRPRRRRRGQRRSTQS